MSDKISQRLLARAHSPDTASQIYRDKIAHRPLLLRPTSPSSRREDARTARQKLRAAQIASRRSSNKPHPLSAGQKRARCVYDIPKSQQKFDIYVPLHQMWASYMQDVLGIGKKRGDGTLIMGVSAQSAGQQLVTADFHGADVEVVRSRCVSRVGVRGIVVKDTKFTFEIITKDNKLKILPKEHTIFRFEVPLPSVTTSDGQESTQSPPLVFELHGSQFETSAPGRAMKKFKIHVDPDL
ncbi:putative ribonuclease P complex subunit Pop4 [Viridothelium virens]|uniref:Ribonuclease P protein subunit n=1 Tax=Viridothelium virens TaxID=1048519 RepID=A0A6A6HRG8_VIRVR|nr:putative ribonuclease P complex subunit Pop4 [Viridothelium virens]